MSTSTIKKTVTEYESVWYFADFWPGEYPPRFSVLKEGVALRGRAEMRLSAPQTVWCPLPKSATFSPWNNKRNEADNVLYRTVAQVATVTMTEAVEIPAYPEQEGEEDVTLSLEAGDTLELLIYQGEGFALYRYQGKNYVIEALPDSVEIEDNLRDYDLWLNLPADNGERGWVLLRDALATEGVATGIGPDGFGMAYDLLHPEDLILDGIKFASGGAELTPASEQILEEFGVQFFWALDVARDTGRNVDNLVFEIGGHTDSVGNSASNQQLSQERAKAVVDYLAERSGSEQRRFKAVGYGESQPIADNSTVEGREVNRRVELKVFSA